MPKLPRRTLPVALAVVASALVAGFLIAGGDGPGDDAARPSASPTKSPIPVVLPGRPGESAAVVDSDDVTAPDGSVYNQLDVTFVRMMIVHHGQAVQLATLAQGRAANPQILAVAERIRGAQLPEITMMKGWLELRKLPVEDPRGGHEHASMAGMHTPEAISALAALSGAEFDRRFVEMMSAHHAGAVRMATDVLKVGKNQQIDELATSIVAEQSVEIARMREIVGG
jgi:uncharacterized protein (DUF305 family)